MYELNPSDVLSVIIDNRQTVRNSILIVYIEQVMKKSTHERFFLIFISKHSTYSLIYDCFYAKHYKQRQKKCSLDYFILDRKAIFS